MKTRFNFFVFLIASLITADFNDTQVGACATEDPAARGAHHHKPTASEWKKYWSAHMMGSKSSERKPADINAPLPDSNSANPWGGNNVSQRLPEAALANVVSRALNEGFARSDVQDVLVSIPAIMQNSNYRPYDLQSNAAIQFGDAGWSYHEPLVVSSLIKLNSKQQIIRFRFNKHLPISTNAVVFSYHINDKMVDKSLTGTREYIKDAKPGEPTDFIVEWAPSANEAPNFGDLFQNRVAFLKLQKANPNDPDPWKGFPVDFRDVVKKSSDLLAMIPADKRNLAKGTVLDPERISVQGSNNNTIPFANLKQFGMGSEVNADEYFPVSGTGIHDRFPDAEGRRTAIGRGNTIVFEKSPAPFKSAYICFEKRNLAAESTFHVPSGAGWHEIGDGAETVLNTLENAPVVFGYANGSPVSPPLGRFDYNVHDVLVFRKLFPGSGIVTSAGARTRDEGRRSELTKNDGRNYHWFVFHHDHDVCAVEWVHPCIPTATNQLGFQCPK